MVSSVIKLTDGRFAKNCPQCGEQQTYLRHNYAKESLRLGKLCKGCSNKIMNNTHSGFYRDIRISWIKKCKVCAETRGLEWSLSEEFIWQTYLAQEKKCALSGLPIGWSKHGQIHTASIDRIDSDIGYVVDNIQLVHKDINFMKQAFPQTYFIEMCKRVAEENK